MCKALTKAESTLHSGTQVSINLEMIVTGWYVMLPGVSTARRWFRGLLPRLVKLHSRIWGSGRRVLAR